MDRNKAQGLDGSIISLPPRIWKAGTVHACEKPKGLTYLGRDFSQSQRDFFGIRDETRHCSRQCGLHHPSAPAGLANELQRRLLVSWFLQPGNPQPVLAEFEHRVIARAVTHIKIGAATDSIENARELAGVSWHWELQTAGEAKSAERGAFGVGATAGSSGWTVGVTRQWRLQAAG